jgi:phosphatidylglycerol---prolipoprotein diacylglyceryl transferase
MEAPLSDTTFRSSLVSNHLGVGLSLYAPSGRPGLLFLGSAVAYGIGRFGPELLRADASSTALPTRINVAFSAVLLLVSLAAFVLKLR